MRTVVTTLVAGATLVALAATAPALAADPNVLCHKTVVKQLEKYKKTHLKLYRNCLDKENRNLIPGCLDSVSDAKLLLTNQKVSAVIAKKCTLPILATLGYRSDCHYGPATVGVGGTCFNLPVTTPTEFAECMKCWKGAEFSRYVATLYASHAQEVCGTALDDTSPTCSAVGCTSPLPDQRNLGDSGEGDCQRGMARAALNYLLKREKILENCLLKLGSLPTCLGDGNVQLKLGKAEIQKETLIKNFCGNRDPIANPPFCCRTGMGQTCTVAVDRSDCTDNLGGNVQEGKVCGSATCAGGTNAGAACTTGSECPGGTCMGSCDNIPGNKNVITWWEHCPTNEPCPGPTLANLDGLIQCVDATADQLVGNVLCLQFPNGSACPTPNPTPTP